MSLGAYTIIRNEAAWVGFCVMAAKEVVSEFVFFDGNSNDGTVQLLEYIAKKYKIDIKITLDQDPKDLRDDYVKVFNDCLKQVKSDYAFFLHPDMIVVGNKGIPKKGPMAYYTKMRTFGGDPRGEIFEFTEGRGDKWKNIMLNDFGLHYFGHYGIYEEDMYFSDITGAEHVMHGDFTKYPFKVEDSGIELFHYSDVRTYKRRLGRMATCLENQDNRFSREAAEILATTHPRVTFGKSTRYPGFDYKQHTVFPEVFSKYNDEFAYILGRKPEEFCLLPIKKEVEC